MVQPGIPTDSLVLKTQIPRRYLKIEACLLMQWLQYSVIPHTHLVELCAPAAWFVRALLDWLHIDLGKTIYGEVLIRMKRQQFLGFPCLTAICEGQGVQGIHHTGAPYGTFNMQDDRVVLTAAEDVRKKLEAQVDRMPEDVVGESRGGVWSRGWRFPLQLRPERRWGLFTTYRATSGLGRATVHEDREWVLPYPWGKC